MPDIGKPKRSDTLPMSSISSSTRSLRDASKKVLVYDFESNSVVKMKRSECEEKYAKLPPRSISIISIPKGASSMDIFPDELQCETPEPISPEDSYMDARPRGRSSSPLASIQIPDSVFALRWIRPSAYADLVVIRSASSSLTNSPNSSRSNTANAHATSLE